MKISLNWLTDYVDVSMPASQLAELLTQTGLSCDEIIETETDIILDLDITSNRPDCLGYLGVAREIAAATGAKFTPPQIPKLPTSGRAEELTSVEVLEAQLCPRYTARVIRDVKVGPSPSWLIERLEAVGLRSINNVVDITNYVLFEYSQPLHSFDYDKLIEQRIVVRRAAAGEQIVAIDGTKCTLDNSMLVIADAKRPVAVAGVMGGLDTEVSEGTTNVLIESARFDPLSIRRTSRKLQLMSESNYRFERGVDPVAVDEASLRACELLVTLAAGRPAEGVIDVWTNPYRPPRVAMRTARAKALLGMDIPIKRQMEILERLGLSPELQDRKIICTIPSHRADLAREVDLIEEVARLEGYRKIPVADKVTHAVTAETLTRKVRRSVGEALTAAGFDEAVTHSFVDAREAELFDRADTVVVDSVVRKTNSSLRPTLLASLLRVCKTNQDAGNVDVHLFELASVFAPRAGEAMPAEHAELAMVTTGDLQTLRGALDALVERVAPAAALAAVAASAAGFSSDAAAEIRLDGEPVGVIGVISTKVRDYYGLERAVAAAALRFDALLRRAGRTRTYKPVPKYPAVRRDLSLIVDEAITWRQLMEVIDAVAQPMRVGVDYVTTYRGKPIGPGRKSFTVTLTYRSPDGTLRSEQVDAQLKQVIAMAEEKLSAELRR